MNMQKWLFLFAAVQAIGAIASVLMFFGIAPKAIGWGWRMPSEHSWILWLSAFLFIGTIISSAIGWMKVTSRSNKNWEKIDKIPIIGKSFFNERVEIDGYKFSGCQFRNVTLVFKGTAPFAFLSCEFLQSINVDATQAGPAVGAVVKLDAEIRSMLIKAGLKDNVDPAATIKEVK